MGSAGRFPYPPHHHGRRHTSCNYPKPPAVENGHLARRSAETCGRSSQTYGRGVAREARFVIRQRAGQPRKLAKRPCYAEASQGTARKETATRTLNFLPRIDTNRHEWGRARTRHALFLRFLCFLWPILTLNFCLADFAALHGLWDRLRGLENDRSLKIQLSFFCCFSARASAIFIHA